jgi:IS30 family transposase
MKKSEITKEFGYLKIDGKYYEFNEKSPESTSYLQVSPEKVKKKIKIAKEITEKLKNSLDKEAVLMESLTKLSTEYLEHIHNSLYNSKRKIKPRTREHHCVDMKVGKLVIPIVD